MSRRADRRSDTAHDDTLASSTRLDHVHTSQACVRSHDLQYSLTHSVFHITISCGEECTVIGITSECIGGCDEWCEIRGHRVDGSLMWEIQSTNALNACIGVCGRCTSRAVACILSITYTRIRDIVLNRHTHIHDCIEIIL